MPQGKLKTGFNNEDTAGAQPGDPLTVHVRATTNEAADHRTINPSGMAVDEANRGTITHIAIPKEGSPDADKPELPTDAKDLPARAVLAAPFAYDDDEGTRHSWAQGQEIATAAEIEHLHSRGARLKPAE